MHPDKQQRTEVSLREAVEHVVRIFRGRLEGQRITFEVQLEADLPLLHVNASQLQRILTNFTSNAIDALLEKRKQMDAAWQAKILFSARYLPQQQRIEMSFSDNGPGISESLQDRMFDPFVTTKEPGKGTGLGLSEVHGMLKEHSAEVQYQPLPDEEGARFVILFPKNQEADDE